MKCPALARIALFLLLLTAPATARPFGDVSAAEQKARTKVAEEILDFAAWCAEHDAAAAGRAALEEARGLDHLLRTLHATEQALDAIEADAVAEDDLAKRRARDGKAVAKAYDRLAGLKHSEEDDDRFRGYALRALAWEASKARVGRLLAVVEDHAKARRPVEAGLALDALRRADPEGDAEGRYDEIMTRLAQEDVLMVRGAKTPLFAFVSLPRKWRKGATVPVLVAVDGAGCGFLGCARGFASARGSRDAIVISPCTLSNTNALDAKKYPMYDPAVLAEWDGKRIDFDGPGVDAVIDLVAARFGGESRVFATGFSGGGNWCYWKLLQQPDRVRGASPACANFAGYGLQGAPGAGDGGGPPVHLMTGAQDPHRDFTFGNKESPGIEPQTDRAEAALKELGYTRVRRTMIDGAKHSALRKEVWEFIDAVLDGSWSVDGK